MDTHVLGLSNWINHGTFHDNLRVIMSAIGVMEHPAHYSYLPIYLRADSQHTEELRFIHINWEAGKQGCQLAQNHDKTLEKVKEEFPMAAAQ